MSRVQAGTVEAIADLLSIARLPPGHHPGAAADHSDHNGQSQPRRSRPVTSGHCCHDKSRPVTPVTAGHDRAFRTRGHAPGVTNQCATGRVRVRTAPSGHDLSTAVTAEVTAAASQPGSLPGAPGRVRERVNGEPELRGGDRRGGGNHHPIQAWPRGRNPSTPTNPRRTPSPGNERT